MHWLGILMVVIVAAIAAAANWASITYAFEMLLTLSGYAMMAGMAVVIVLLGYRFLPNLDRIAQKRRQVQELERSIAERKELRAKLRKE